MKVNEKKIHTFLKSLNEAESIYAKHCIDFGISLWRLKIRHELSDKAIAAHFSISERKVKSYLKGACNFGVHDLAKLETLHVICAYERKERT